MTDIQVTKEALVQQLDAISDAASLDYVCGYLFALVCAPEPVEFETWMQDLIPSQVEEVDEALLFNLVNLHGALSEQIYETGFDLHKHLSLDVTQADYAAEDAPVVQWSSGFAQGVSYYIDNLASAEQVDDAHRDALLQAATVLSLFSDQDALRAQARANDLPTTEFALVIWDMMGDFAVGFAELIEQVALQSGLYNDEHWDDD